MSKHAAVSRKPLPSGWELARIIVYAILVGLGAFLVAWGVIDQETVDQAIPVVMGVFTSFAGTMAIANVPAAAKEEQTDLSAVEEVGSLPAVDLGTQEGATPPEYALDGSSQTVANEYGHVAARGMSAH